MAGFAQPMPGMFGQHPQMYSQPVVPMQASTYPHPHGPQPRAPPAGFRQGGSKTCFATGMPAATCNCGSDWCTRQKSGGSWKPQAATGQQGRPSLHDKVDALTSALQAQQIQGAAAAPAPAPLAPPAVPAAGQQQGAPVAAAGPAPIATAAPPADEPPAWAISLETRIAEAMSDGLMEIGKTAAEARDTAAAALKAGERAGEIARQTRANQDTIEARLRELEARPVQGEWAGTILEALEKRLGKVETATGSLRWAGVGKNARLDALEGNMEALQQASKRPRLSRASSRVSSPPLAPPPPVPQRRVQVLSDEEEEEEEEKEEVEVEEEDHSCLGEPRLPPERGTRERVATPATDGGAAARPQRERRRVARGSASA